LREGKPNHGAKCGPRGVKPKEAGLRGREEVIGRGREKGKQAGDRKGSLRKPGKQAKVVIPSKTENVQSPARKRGVKETTDEKGEYG